MTNTTKASETPKPTVAAPAIDIPIPAFDTPSQALSPIVNAAIEGGATVRPHPDDVTKIIVTISDKKSADEFEAAITAALQTD